MERAKEESEAKKKDIDRLNKNKEPRGRILGAPKVAATYSPTTQCSTIGDAELNDPVRNGKGWDLSAITTLICEGRRVMGYGLWEIPVTGNR